jgi:HEAT repeat protein
MRDTTHPDAARNSIIALSLIGTPAAPTLTAAFADTNYPLRYVVFSHLLDLNEPNSYRPHLGAALVDPDLRVRNMATNALEQLKYLSFTNAPAK